MCGSLCLVALDDVGQLGVEDNRYPSPAIVWAAVWSWLENRVLLVGWDHSCTLGGKKTGRHGIGNECDEIPDGLEGIGGSMGSLNLVFLESISLGCRACFDAHSAFNLICNPP